jgi:hypothetical protein
MKDLLIFVLCLVLYEAYPQGRDTTISVYSLDYISADSFYLVRVDTVYRPGKVRPEIVYQGELYRDTSQLNEAIRQKQLYLQQLQLQLKALQTKITETSYYIDKVTCLRDSVIFQLSCSPEQRATKPTAKDELKKYPEFEPQPVEEKRKRSKARRKGM